jgi:hypothetical protein
MYDAGMNSEAGKGGNMDITTFRAFTRNQSKAPIMILMPETGESQKAEMINSSVGGMCFTTEKPLKAGATISIQLVDMAPDPYWTEANNQYVAEVRWCTENSDGITTNYLTGVRFIKEKCSRCNAKIPPNQGNSVELCPACYENYCMVSDGQVRECIANYLSGNVL